MIVVNEIALTVVLFILAGTVVGWYWMMWDAVKHLRKRNHEGRSRE